MLENKIDKLENKDYDVKYGDSIALSNRKIEIKQLIRAKLAHYITDDRKYFKELKELHDEIHKLK